jgi:hypothetical protein
MGNAGRARRTSAGMSTLASASGLHFAAERRASVAPSTQVTEGLLLTHYIIAIIGGEGGIRTLGTGLSPYNCLAGSPVRPLRHLSDGRAYQRQENTYGVFVGPHSRLWAEKILSHRP